MESLRRAIPPSSYDSTQVRQGAQRRDTRLSPRGRLTFRVEWRRLRTQTAGFVLQNFRFFFCHLRCHCLNTEHFEPVPAPGRARGVILQLELSQWITGRLCARLIEILPPRLAPDSRDLALRGSHIGAG